MDDATLSILELAKPGYQPAVEGTSLEKIQHLDTFWFAWSTYQPETDFVEE